MQIDDSTVAHRAYSRHNEGITPDEVTSDIPQEHSRQLRNSFYRTKVVITEKA